MTEAIKYGSKYLLTHHETADSLIARLTFMVREIEAKGSEDGAILDWPNILLETEDWAVDERSLVGEDYVENYRTIRLALRGVKED